MNCCSLQQVLISLGLSAIAAYIGWNLMKWWRATFRKPIPQAQKEYVRETFNPYQRPLGNLGYWANMMMNDPNPNRFYQPKNMANQYGSYYQPNPSGPYSFGTAPPPPKKPEEKVIEGEVIRGEPLRIEHDNRRIEHDT